MTIIKLPVGAARDRAIEVIHQVGNWHINCQHSSIISNRNVC